MPWERRGDFVALIRGLQQKYGFEDEIKWNHLSRRKEDLYRALIDAFFERSWLMFHALIVRKGYTDKSFHKDFDEEKQKRFVMLLEKKIGRFRRGDPAKTYHVRVDPLPSRYKKADEKAFKLMYRIGYAAERGSPAGGASRHTEDLIIGFDLIECRRPISR
jgi:hypothetical protein